MRSPPEAARMSDLCRHVSVHALPFHHILVHDPSGSGTSHSLLCLTSPFSESLDTEVITLHSTSFPRLQKKVRVEDFATLNVFISFINLSCMHI